MEKSIAAFEARRQFGKVLQKVEVERDCYLVERHGEPVAALVPMEVYEQWKKSRAAFFATIRAATAHANMDPDEAEALADEAAHAVRREMALEAAERQRASEITEGQANS